MEEKVAYSYIAYTPLRKNPLNWNRNSTNSVFILVFIVAAFCYWDIFYEYYSYTHVDLESKWHASVYSYNDVNEFEYEWSLYYLYRDFQRFTVGAINSYLFSAGIAGIAIFASFAGSVMLIFLLVVWWLPKISTYLGIILMGILTVLMCPFIMYRDIHNFGRNISPYELFYFVQNI